MSDPHFVSRDPTPATGYEEPDLERPASAALPEQSHARHDPYAALRVRDYRFYSAGWVLSVIGQQIQEVAVGWDIFNRASVEGGLNRFMAVGWVGAVLALPVITLAIPAGALADRYDRRKLITVSMIGGAASALWLAWLSHVHGALWLMYLCLFLGAVASAVGWPARWRCCRKLSRRRYFPTPPCGTAARSRSPR